jgi:PAN domain
LQEIAMRIFVLAIVMTIFSGSAFAVDGTNLPGRDYANFPAPSAFVCRTSCGGESRCQAYTWVKPGIQGPTGHCWLKSSLPAIVKDRCCDSAPRNFISMRDLRAEDKINRPGSDFKNFVTNSWKTCEAACAEGKICLSWTYVRPGVQGPAGRCWLKNVVARPVADTNTVSGVKFKPASVRID